LLDIKQLDGAQPYDQFVKRRLGAEYQYIDRLGRRYERATQNLQLITQSFTGLELYKMQVGAEIALFAFLIPYYFSAILASFISQVWMPYISLFLWAVFGCKAVYQFVNDYLGEGKSKGINSAVAFFILIVGLFFVFLYKDSNTNVKAFDQAPIEKNEKEVGKKILHLPAEDDEAAQERELDVLKNIETEISENKKLYDDLITARDEENKLRVKVEDVSSALKAAERRIQDLEAAKPTGGGSVEPAKQRRGNPK
jgi:hypothetical protein